MWKSFFVAIKDWARYPNKYLGRPKIPKYKAKKGGRFVLSLDSNKLKIKEWLCIFCMETIQKKFNNLFRTNAKDRILQCRFIPRCRNI